MVRRDKDLTLILTAGCGVNRSVVAHLSIAPTVVDRSGLRCRDEVAAMTHELEEEGGVPERFEYFMVRLTRSAREPDRVAGLIEWLGSGEKRNFDTGEQLVRLVGGRFALDSNMQPTTVDRNASRPDPTATPS
jgi:hypothetical protein